ncbi:MAG: hypothetical protein KBD94_02815 [Pyrinomonadaceae bacterium]|nr:hypothetical protein [Pyrinomonadaceae bacterium]
MFRIAIKKVLPFLIAFFCVNFASAQNQSFSMKVAILNISTDRSLVFSNFGKVSVHAIAEGGNSISRTATYGSFGVTTAINSCIPCQKGTVFGSMINGNLSWLTEGTAQGPPPQEWTTFQGQIITPSWSVPVQSPRRSPLVKYVPVRFLGTLVIRRNTGASTTTYTDSDVDLTGYMRAEFIRDYSALLFSWRGVQITASSTP